ncbi:MAG: SCO family protein [Bacteroidales bacterium]
MMRNTLILNLCLCSACLPALAQTSLFDKQMQVGFKEKQGQFVALDTRLVNEAGDTVILGDILKRPTILGLVYYNCTGACSPLMMGMSKFIDAIDLQPGKDYDVFTVSFDPSENIALAREKKASFVGMMEKKADAVNWRFFVSDSLDIAKLASSVGFEYRKVEGQYIHPTGLIALASNGKITRYIRGVDFSPFDVKITLVEAADGKIGPSINRLLSVCYSYSSTGNQYVFDVLKVSAILILFIAVLIFAYLALSRVISKKFKTLK